MKDLFSWRLPPSESDFADLWENAVFVFDTNFLLDLYRVSHSTAKDFLNILEHLEKRIWLPHQVASEFLNRREGIIDSELKSFQKALTAIEKWKDDELSFNRLKGSINEAGRIVGAEVALLFNQQDAYKAAIEEVEKCFRKKIEELAKSHSLLNAEEDYILNKLLVLFDGKVGKPDCIEILQKIYKEGEERYKQKRPPGFEDKDKPNDNGNERKYGDLILWKQILAFAKITPCPIIFVTSEKKEDWWYKKEGKIISPHFELRREFKEQVDRSFWMYQTNRFLEIAKEKLHLEISQESIEEANIIAETEIIKEQVTPENLRSFPHRQANDSHNKLARLLQHHRNRQGRLIEQLQYRPVYENQLVQVLQQNQIDNERAKRFIEEFQKIRNNKDSSDPLNLI
jgi:PIN like domain